MKIIHEVEHNEEILEVEFEGYPRFEIETSFEHDKFGKEYPYPSFENVSDPSWNDISYTIKENESILHSLPEVMKIMCDMLEKEAKDMANEY